jgi:hypothetical protein
VNLIDRLLRHAEIHESFCPNDDEQKEWAADLRKAAALLREHEQAKHGVTDQVVAVALAAYDDYIGPSDLAMRAALEAVWPAENSHE